jgi:hypothetical protein
VKIFSLTGQQVYAGRVYGSKTIPLPAGVYIVKAGERTVKTAVK